MFRNSGIITVVFIVVPTMNYFQHRHRHRHRRLHLIRIVRTVRMSSSAFETCLPPYHITLHRQLRENIQQQPHESHHHRHIHLYNHHRGFTCVFIIVVRVCTLMRLLFLSVVSTIILFFCITIVSVCVVFLVCGQHLDPHERPLNCTLVSMHPKSWLSGPSSTARRSCKYSNPQFPHLVFPRLQDSRDPIIQDSRGHGP